MAETATRRQLFATLAALLIPFLAILPSLGQSPASALATALKGTQAAGVVLDQRSGAVLARVGPDRRGTPGSAIKPLLLAYALAHGIVQPETQVYCRRNLRIDGQPLPCTHPDDQPVFTAERALAESCNTWFAELGRRFTGPQLEAALAATHLPHRDMRSATTSERQRAVLGLAGVSASPLELARAYREIIAPLPRESVVTRGLTGSVDYGMASPARVQGLKILGKTGTASNNLEAWTHGWFAGELPGRLTIVIYVPHGDGGTAAALAQRFFLALDPGTVRR
jgi:cell division protein FtsI/penicillin-binding protein 2